LARAREFFERALVLDPENIDALAWMAFVDIASAGLLPNDRLARLSTAEAAAERALSAVP
jgi:hypothetical protein